MRRSYRYKARLTACAARRADRQLHILRDLYNAALEERRDHWKRGERVNFVTQCRQLTEIRAADPEYGALDRHATEWTLSRLERAFQAFFRRVKNGERPGYPRFKGRDRFSSITFRQRGWKLDGRHLTLRGIGRIKLHLSRPIEGTAKTVTLKRDRCGDWWVTFSCEGVPARPLADTGRAIGVDLGLTSFLATSDGETVDNPRHLRTAEADLRRAQRRVSRRKRGGSRRRKAVRVLARKHRAVQDARRDFHFKKALDLVRRYDVIAVENLNIRGLARTRLAKSVSDAGWGQFLRALRTKAESAGREVIAVDPRGTSQECSGCGSVSPKSLSVRVHRCTCGLELDRDVNAARNILARAERSGSGGQKNVAA
jgi:putative transposase